MRITFIGGGNMAGAIIAGLAQQSGHDVQVVDRNADKLDRLRQAYGVSTWLAVPEAFSREEIVVLAIKPQQLKALCLDLAPRLNGALVVSIAAGVRSQALSRWLNSPRVVRAMPNTPAMIGKGMSGLYAPDDVDAEDRAAAATILQAVGQVQDTKSARTIKANFSKSSSTRQ